MTPCYLEGYLVPAVDVGMEPHFIISVPHLRFLRRKNKEVVNRA